LIQKVFNMFLDVVLIIAILSFILAVYSLKKESHKKELSKAKKDLSKSRVIFQKRH